MPSTTLQHPMNTYRPPVEIPKWMIVLDERGKVTGFRDLETLRNFIHREFGDTALRATKYVSRILKDADERLESTDVYILENREADRLHFCRASFRDKRAYIRSVEKEREDATT